MIFINIAKAQRNYSLAVKLIDDLYSLYGYEGEENLFNGFDENMLALNELNLLRQLKSRYAGRQIETESLVS